jgi:methyltransferase
MALNKFMHPRNPYRNKKPNFQALAAKYEDFQAQCSIDEKGHVRLDFKKPESLRALTWALLKEDFELDVELPLDRLIPTVPLRLNYILWLEDLFQNSKSLLKGIDIGKST